MRQLDKVVAEAAIGSILTGVNFTTTTSAADDGVQTVTAGSGLTYDVMREIRQTLNSKDVGLNGEKLLSCVLPLCCCLRGADECGLPGLG